MNDPTHKTPDERNEPDRDQLTGHNYDDIQEYDNPTPGWWIWLFVLSVVFSIFYFTYYHSPTPDRSVYDRYDDSVGAYQKKKLEALGIKELTVTEPNMLAWMVNPGYMDYGRSVYKQNCTSCHGDNGQGLVGPNMTDDFYKNVTQLTDVPRVIDVGASNGAMPSWRRLGAVDVALVGAYVASLRGKNIPGSRGQEGKLIAPWPPLPKPATAPATTRAASGAD